MGAFQSPGSNAGFVGLTLVPSGDGRNRVVANLARLPFGAADPLVPEFRQRFDRLLEPECAALLIRNSPDAFGRLMTAKSELAGLLSERLAAPGPDDTQGDRAEAVERLEQSLLTRLSNVRAADLVVQVPLDLKVTETSGFNAPPRLDGSLTAGPGPCPSSALMDAPKLSLETHREGPRWLTFLATGQGSEVGAASTIEPTWKISHVEHQFETFPSNEEYVPSAWLTFLLPEEPGSPLNVALRPLTVCSPARGRARGLPRSEAPFALALDRFHQEFDRRAPALPALMGTEDGPALVALVEEVVKALSLAQSEKAAPTGASLESILAGLLAPLAATGTARTLRVSADYLVPIVRPADGSPPVLARTEAFRDAEWDFGAGAFASNVRVGQPPAAGASLVLSLSPITEDGAGRLPALRIEEILLPVPDGGWPPA